MTERNKEIVVHQEMLKAQIKCCENERQTIRYNNNSTCTVEPPIKDPSRGGHNSNNLRLQGPKRSISFIFSYC